MEEKVNNSSKNHIIIEVILLVIILGLGGYIAYSKIVSTENKNTTLDQKQEENLKQEENTKEESVYVPTNMEKVSQELNNYLNTYLTYNSNNLNKNMLLDATDKLELINIRFERTRTATYTNYSDGRQDFAYVSLDAYKAKYKEFYGNLDNFEAEMKNALAVSPANELDSTMSKDLVAWNNARGGTAYTVTGIQANNVVYNETNKQYTITGVVNYESSDVTPNSIAHNFEIIYANNQEQNYLISLMLS